MSVWIRLNRLNESQSNQVGWWANESLDRRLNADGYESGWVKSGSPNKSKSKSRTRFQLVEMGLVNDC